MSSTGKPIQAWYIGSDGNIYLRNLRIDLPVSSLTVDGVTATLVSEGHGLAGGDVVNVSHCTTAFLNGDWVVASAPDADTITFTIPTAYSQTPTLTPKAEPGRFILCGAYLDDGATVQATMADSGGTPVTGVGTLTFDYKTRSTGLFVARLPDTASLTDGTRYTLTVTATAASGEVLKTLLTGTAVNGAF
jgi:hypothetical protein